MGLDAIHDREISFKQSRIGDEASSGNTAHVQTLQNSDVSAYLGGKPISRTVIIGPSGAFLAVRVPRDWILEVSSATICLGRSLRHIHHERAFLGSPPRRVVFPREKGLGKGNP
jgi:hypothetical protein